MRAKSTASISTRFCPLRFRWWYTLCAVLVGACAAPTTTTLVTTRSLTPAVFVVTFATSSGATMPTNTLVAIDAATGLARWQIAPVGEIAAMPAVQGGLVYLGTNDPNAALGQAGTLTAFDARTGAPRWTARTGQIAQVVALTNGVLIGEDLPAPTPTAGTPTMPLTPTMTPRDATSFTLAAFSATSGAPLWTYASSRADLSIPPVLMGNHIALAVTSSITTLNPIPTSTVLVLDARNGQLRWQRHLNALVAGMVATPAALYLTADEQINQPRQGPGGLALALGASDGQILWQYPTSLPLTAPCTDGLTVFIGQLGAKNTTLVALDGLHGLPRWQATTASLVAGLGLPSMAVGGEQIFASMGAPARSGVLALSVSNGQILWQRLGILAATVPTVYLDTVYVGFTANGTGADLSHIEALDGSLGLLLWRLQLPGMIEFPLVVG